MPRRGRHRTSLPLRLIAIVTALLLAAGGVVIAGNALADDGESSASSSESSDDSGDSDDEGGSDSDDDSSDSDDSEKSEDDKSQDEKDDDKENEEKQARGGQNGDDEGNKPDEGQKDDDDKGDEEEFPGRDEIAPAGRSDYVDITQVTANGNIGEGGVFGGGSYSVDCGVSDHRNSDNYMAAPGKRNGAQHVHDYVGNRTVDADTEPHSLEGDATSCGNGDSSTFFWPVLRDLRGTGPDVGEDGGSLDGNVGAPLQPTSADLTFHGHPGQETRPLPDGLMMIMGNAKAKKQDGDDANAKYTCSGFEDRVTDKYPICPPGSNLKRLLDYPSCWDGENIDSKDFRSHIFYPDENGNCDDDQVPVPQLRITLTYDQPGGRAFSIDSFPDNQHHPSTDHSDYENAAGQERNRAGADCINAGQRCRT